MKSLKRTWTNDRFFNWPNKFLRKKKMFFFWFNDFTEQSFNEKINEIGGKWTITLSMNKMSWNKMNAMGRSRTMDEQNEKNEPAHLYMPSILWYPGVLWVTYNIHTFVTKKYFTWPSMQECPIHNGKETTNKNVEFKNTKTWIYNSNLIIHRFPRYHCESCITIFRWGSLEITHKVPLTL